MGRLNIGNETIAIAELELFINRSISGYRRKIADLDMNTRLAVPLLCLYAKTIKQQTILLAWVKGTYSG